MIIPVFRVVTSQKPIKRATTIEAGQAISLDSDGYVVKATTSSRVIGLAADTNRALMAGEWTNRISDLGNETYASGQMSYYCNGGEFYLDLNDNALLRGDDSTVVPGAVINTTYTPGDTLVVSATAGVLGKTGGTQVVATVLEAESALDGGIPGEFEPLSGNLADSDVPRKWVKVKLEL